VPDSRKGVAKQPKAVNKSGYRAKAIPKRIKDEAIPRPVAGKAKSGHEAPLDGGPRARAAPGEILVLHPLDTTKLANVKIPVDPSGAASESGVVMMTGNVYLPCPRTAARAPLLRPDDDLFEVCGRPRGRSADHLGAGVRSVRFDHAAQPGAQHRRRRLSHRVCLGQRWRLGAQVRLNVHRLRRLRLRLGGRVPRPAASQLFESPPDRGIRCVGQGPSRDPDQAQRDCPELDRLGVHRAADRRD